MLNLHVLGTIMVDAGNRAASVTIHRVMDTEHGLGNMTGEIMLQRYSFFIPSWNKGIAVLSTRKHRETD